MPLPRWLAKVNRRVFNPIEIRRGRRPVLIHVGRVTGRTRLTPLDAHRVPGGYLLIPMYGPRTDWVRNVMAAGEARLRLEGREVAVTNPQLVPRSEIWGSVAGGTRVPPGIHPESLLLLLDDAPAR